MSDKNRGSGGSDVSDDHRLETKDAVEGRGSRNHVRTSLAAGKQGGVVGSQRAPQRGLQHGEVENSIRASAPKMVRQEFRGRVPVDPASAFETEEGRKGPSRPDSAARGDAPGSTSPQTEAADSNEVPEHIRRQFIQIGRKYYFADGARAFTDRGRSLTTPSENTEVIKSLVTIAQTRGWNEISVRGTERFRKEAWFAARVVGLEVHGYRPSEFEQGRLIRTIARQNEGPSMGHAYAETASYDRATNPRRVASPTSREETAAARRHARGVLLTGTFLEYGRAPYHHDPHERMSYFIKLETARGDRVIWGVDLERAFKESLTRPELGDTIGLRAVRQDAVKVKAAERDPEGQVIAERDVETHRNRWIVEKHAFFQARAAAAQTLGDPAIDPKQAVKQYPELVGTYLQVRAAEIAARRFRDPEDRQKFVAAVRSSLAASVARGEPLPPVRLRERSAERRSHKSRDREPAQVRG
jgi:hypothetical protein